MLNANRIASLKTRAEAIGYVMATTTGAVQFHVLRADGSIEMVVTDWITDYDEVNGILLESERDAAVVDVLNTSNAFGCTIEQAQAQFATNAKQMHALYIKAGNSGKKVNGYTAAELLTLYEKLALRATVCANPSLSKQR